MEHSTKTAMDAEEEEEEGYVDEGKIHDNKNQQNLLNEYNNTTKSEINNENDNNDDDDVDVDEEGCDLLDIEEFTTPLVLIEEENGQREGQQHQTKKSSNGLNEQSEEKPPEGYQWDDDAIMDCFQIAISTHDGIQKVNANTNANDNNDNDENEDDKSNGQEKKERITQQQQEQQRWEWQIPQLNRINERTDVSDLLNNWDPTKVGTLPLPIWAVDPSL